MGVKGILLPMVSHIWFEKKFYASKNLYKQILIPLKSTENWIQAVIG